MYKIRLWLPVAAWCLLIFALSAVPNLDSGLEFDYPLRKAAHMAEYAVLFLLLRRALRGTCAETAFWSWAAGLLTVLYAMSDEYHQTFVPGRSGRWSDVAVDAAGAALAGLWTGRRGAR
ncbi:MAG: VanZ family protein [Elusimicrobia bacterium]|nr:VanZ family protein [Elusimicrobiota bacterium]